MPLFRPARARHRRLTRRSRLGAFLAAAAATTVAATTALVAADVSTATAHDRSFPTMLRELRQCESGDNYRINTGNGYYGAYQFNLGTWRGVGGAGYPHQNPPHVQDEMATRLYEQRGWSPWPSCSRKRGLHATRVERPWAGSPPTGHVDHADGQAGGMTVAGWAFDRDTQPGAIEVNAHVDGAVEHVRLRADQHRPDVGQAHGVGHHHGFSGFVPARPGWHRVCLYALNQRGGHDSFLGCKDALVGEPPAGQLERAVAAPGGISVAGWAFDRDITPAPIEINAHVDHAPEYVRLRADQHRPDVGEGHGVGHHHGFSGVVPTSVGRHTVCLYALNHHGGHDTFLGCQEVVVAQPPIGELESVDVVPGGVRVRGWTLDRDTPQRSTYADVHLDGEVARGVIADEPRPDIARKYGVPEARGFDVVVPSGTRICAFAIDTTGEQRNSLVGCRRLPA